MKFEVIAHYDALIDENNDPVFDPQPLKDYMDKWDGPNFIAKMELHKNKSILEIGIGTGRIAIRTAPNCARFIGIDISPKTIERAKKNLSNYSNVNLICDDFLSYNFDEKFDVVYSSLTFMHIKEKQKAILKISKLLNANGLFVLSVDKNMSEYIDMGNRRIQIFPDSADDIIEYMETADWQILEIAETEFANVFVAQKA